MPTYIRTYSGASGRHGSRESSSNNSSYRTSTRIGSSSHSSPGYRVVYSYDDDSDYGSYRSSSRRLGASNHHRSSSYSPMSDRDRRGRADEERYQSSSRGDDYYSTSSDRNYSGPSRLDDLSDLFSRLDIGPASNDYYTESGSSGRSTRSSNDRREDPDWRREISSSDYESPTGRSSNYVDEDDDEEQVHYSIDTTSDDPRRQVLRRHFTGENMEGDVDMWMTREEDGTPNVLAEKLKPSWVDVATLCVITGVSNSVSHGKMKPKLDKFKETHFNQLASHREKKKIQEVAGKRKKLEKELGKLLDEIEQRRSALKKGSLPREARTLDQDRHKNVGTTAEAVMRDTPEYYESKDSDEALDQDRYKNVDTLPPGNYEIEDGKLLYMPFETDQKDWFLSQGGKFVVSLDKLRSGIWGVTGSKICYVKSSKGRFIDLGPAPAPLTKSSPSRPSNNKKKPYNPRVVKAIGWIANASPEKRAKATHENDERIMKVKEQRGKAK
ncbi:hypothetical protein BGW36DRAFT_466390 [Talaromyces proteolyticus]|uniref:Uncharacterized protein n=1 Tax=Talaromyces proteolyticus TaxID=1131652 RepID=A0AAD4KIV1_9EURO|nr:uncharacterized protein BGW36DRAFT_466390 [Talaromyces proteolyticus]KAH8689525.1 hypothetical protein BGW36DRAFT_466390 [Talaromyces proteolyticus]